VSTVAYLQWRIARQRFGQSPASLADARRADVVAQAAREADVIAKALQHPLANEVDADAEVVREAAEGLVGDAGDRASFERQLRHEGLSWEALCNAIGEELRAGLVLEKVGAGAAVDEAQVQAWYERNRTRMVLPERRVGRHILITLNEDYADNTRVRAQQRLGKVADALLAGADFAELALAHSECPSALNGGNLGEVRRGQLYPELETVLFDLSPGEVRAVESPLGLHLIRCDFVFPAEPLSYEAAAPSIRRKLEELERNRVMKAWLREAGEVSA
jgi:nitrogen fixation protein NifM